MARVKTWFQSERDYFSEHIALNTETGVLYWKKDNPTGRGKAGDPVSCKQNAPGGARQVSLRVPGKDKGTNYPLIQIAWLLIHGKQCRHRLETIDGNYENLRPDNIQPTTRKAANITIKTGY